MNQRIALTALLLLAGVGLGGCKFLKKKTPDPEPAVAAASATAAAVAPAPVAAAPAPAYAEPVAAVEPPLDENAIPAPQDFEDEAFEKVTTANFKAELARLNKEIATPAAK